MDSQVTKDRRDRVGKMLKFDAHFVQGVEYNAEIKVPRGCYSCLFDVPKSKRSSMQICFIQRYGYPLGT